MIKFLFIAAFLFVSIGGVFPAQTAAAAETPASAPKAQQEQADPTVVIVNGKIIKASELNAHIAETQLSHEDALEDLIDLKLLRASAAEKKINAPTEPWSQEVRVGIEYALARALALDIPPPNVTLVVDHAWLKDAEDEKGRLAGRTLMERLRLLVVTGVTIPEAYNQLQLDGTAWHIGDHEEYTSIVVPAEVQDLSQGSLSQIIPGDGGLHLFKIHQRRQELQPVSDIRVPLLARLRLDAAIEQPETPPR